MIRLENIKKTYNKGKSNAFEALHGITLEVQNGEMAAIIGASGAGKSTLLHILACIDDYDEGDYFINEERINHLSEGRLAHIRNQYIGMVMQDYALVDSFTGMENVMIPLDFAEKKEKSSVRKEKAMKALKDFLRPEFLGRVDDTALRELYGGAKALIFPGIEDFGIMPVEAQAAGCPVVAFGEGGALETVIEGRTGLFFRRQSAYALQEAIEEFEGKSFAEETCRQNARRFSKGAFVSGFVKFARAASPCRPGRIEHGV